MIINDDVFNRLPVFSLLAYSDRKTVYILIKYAFPDGKNGIIEVRFKQKKDDHLVITVKDNGVGMSTVKNTGQNSLGMKLLKGLSEDLDANLTINGEKGTTISVDFINKPDKNGSL